MKRSTLVPCRYHFHEDLEANVVLDGEATYRFGERSITLKPGTLLWIGPGQPHKMVSAEPSFRMLLLKWRSELLDRAEYSPVEAWSGSPVPLRHIPAAVRAELTYLADEVARRREATKNLGLCYLLARLTEESTREEDASLPLIVRRVSAILTDTSKAFEPRWAASEIGVSYGYLARTFRKHTGKSLTEARTDACLRTFLAVHRPNASLLHSALDSGFGSYVQFFRAFRERFGKGPAEYLRIKGLPSADALPTLASNADHQDNQ